jgi:hypothetical protein
MHASRLAAWLHCVKPDHAPVPALPAAVRHRWSVLVRLLNLCALLLPAAWISACSVQQAYGAGQAWQRLDCNRIADMQERQRCMASPSISYEDYLRQSEAAKGVK